MVLCVSIIARQDAYIETISTDLEAVIRGIRIIEEALNFRAVQTLVVDEQLFVTTESAMSVQLTGTLETPIMAVPTLPLFLLEESSTFAVPEGTSVIKESIAPLGITRETLVIGRARAAQTPRIAV